MDQLFAMRAFVAAVQLRNLGQAAEQLGVSRTLVTRQIQALEHRLNAQLMIRTTRSLTLTATGEKYFLFCEEILAQIDEMDTTMRAKSEEISGELPVLCPKWMAEPIAHVLAEFVKVHPEVRPRLMLESLPLTAYEFLSKGCEVSLNLRKIPDSRIIARKLFDLPYILCASPAYLAGIAPPTVPSDLGKLAGLVQPTYPQWEFRKGDQAERILPRMAFSANSYIALRSAALAGIGVTAIPQTIVKDDLDAGRLMRVMPEWECQSQAVYLSSAPGKSSPMRAQAFSKFIAAWFRANPM